MVTELTIIQRLGLRRRELVMSHAALAARSGVSVPTTKRILSGRGEGSFTNVCALAEALGVPIGLDSSGADDFLRARARDKAERVARLVQGTSALEDQAVDGAVFERLVERTYHELLAGSRRALWEE